MRIVHAADLHLRPDTAGPEGAARLEAFLELCAAAREADLLLLAGDVFDSGEAARDAGLLRKVREGLSSCKAVLVIPGNHEFLNSARPPFEPPPDLGSRVRVCVKRPFELAEFGAARVYAFPFQAGAVTGELFRSLPPPARGEVRVAVLHGTCQDRPNLAMAAYSEEEEGGDLLIRDKDLSAAGFRYAALGHVHRKDDWALANGGRASYPGSTTATGRTEEGARGFNVVSIADDGSVSLEWRRLETAVGSANKDFFAAPGEEAGVLGRIKAFLEGLPANSRAYAKVSGLASRRLLEEGLPGLEAACFGRFKLRPRLILDDVQDADAAPAGQARLVRDYLERLKARAGDVPDEVRSRAAVLGWWAMTTGRRDIDRLLESLKAEAR